MKKVNCCPFLSSTNSSLDQSHHRADSKVFHTQREFAGVIKKLNKKIIFFISRADLDFD